MDERPLRMDGNLAVALAAWMVLLHRRGVLPDSEALAERVRAVSDADSGAALVEAVGELLDDASPEQVIAFCRAELGEAITGAFGEGEREERVRRIRRYQFAQNTPWIARIYERTQGVVRPFWVIVGRLTDQVLLMDPDPYDGIEEQRVVPVADFMVQWELDACTSIAFERSA